MIDSNYKNALKEIYVILQNTDSDLVNKVPLKFREFLQNNMSSTYQPNIDGRGQLEEQHLLPETEAIISLMYRSYWATTEEKQEFLKRDREQTEPQQYKTIEEIFAQKQTQNLNNITLSPQLTVIKKESFINKLFNKIKNVLQKF